MVVTSLCCGIKVKHSGFYQYVLAVVCNMGGQCHGHATTDRNQGWYLEVTAVAQAFFHSKSGWSLVGESTGYGAWIMGGVLECGAEDHSLRCVT